MTKSKDTAPVELRDAELNEANGGWIIIDSMSAPVKAKSGQPMDRQKDGIMLGREGDAF